MAVAKANTTKKPEEVSAAKNNTSKSDIKTTEAKATTPVKAAAPKEEVKAAPVKKEEKKAEPVKAAPAPKKAAAKKPAKKTTRKGAKRGPKPASERTVELYVQYGPKEVSYTELINRIKDMWKEQGKRETSLKSLNVYVKPEEFKAYYVINDGKITGEIDF